MHSHNLKAAIRRYNIAIVIETLAAVFFLGLFAWFAFSAAVTAKNGIEVGIYAFAALLSVGMTMHQAKEIDRWSGYKREAEIDLACYTSYVLED